MKITNDRLAALAINAHIAADPAFHTTLSPEKQQALTDDIRETLAKVDAAAGGLRGLFLLAVGDTHTTFAVHASGACSTRLAVSAVDKGLELAEELAQEKTPKLLQALRDTPELMTAILRELRHDD